MKLSAFEQCRTYPLQLLLSRLCPDIERLNKDKLFTSMRRYKTTLLWVALAFVIMRCSEDNTPNHCYQEPIVEKGNSSEGFFSDECTLYTPSQEEAFFVIQNLSQLVETVICEQDLPEIDFEKHTLLLGKIPLDWCCATALKQEVTKDCEKKEYTYFVQLDNPEGKYQALSTFYHWVIIPKVTSEYQVNYILDLNLET